MDKKKVLFLCTHNSIRSQIAEGFLNTIYGSEYEAYSAGIKPTELNPYAFEVMKEIGIDLSKHYSKSIENFHGEEFDFVVTVCNNAKEICPFYPGKRILHKNFEDPVEVDESVEEIIDRFRKVRNEIKTWIINQFG